MSSRCRVWQHNRQHDLVPPSKRKKIITFLSVSFDVQVTVHRAKFLQQNQLYALISQIYFGIKLYNFQTVPLSIIRSFALYTWQWCMSYRFAESLRAAWGRNASCQQTCMTCTIVVCTVKNSWWRTEKLSKTCRVLFQNKFEKLVHLVGFNIRTFSVHNFNVKLINEQKTQCGLHVTLRYVFSCFAPLAHVHFQLLQNKCY